MITLIVLAVVGLVGAALLGCAIVGRAGSRELTISDSPISGAAIGGHISGDLVVQEGDGSSADN